MLGLGKKPDGVGERKPSIMSLEAPLLLNVEGQVYFPSDTRAGAYPSLRYQGQKLLGQTFLKH